MFIYSVATWTPVHAPCCSSTWKNKGFEKFRTRVKGVYLNKSAATKHAEGLTRRNGTKYFVERHKIRDWHGLVTEGAGI